MREILILGGGSAGCVLAARLSEDPNCRVTLVEAGADLREGTVPEDIASPYPGRAFLNPDHIWPGLGAMMGAPVEGSDHRPPPRRYEQARVLGGGSSINAMAANRGAPSDYDEWEALGATGWNWQNVLPYFRRLEHDGDFGGPRHGSDGPLPVSRYFSTRQSPFVRAVTGAMAARGHALREDQNGEWQDGVFPVAIARDAEGRRVTVAAAYLPASVRARPNLTILTDSHARRILFRANRAVGAEIETGGRATERAASEIILACGALHTPALLMRSGIGPAEDLARHAIPVLADRPGVGRNLMEHPSLALSAYLHPQARLKSPREHQIQACLRLSSGLPGTPAGDMHMAIVAKAAWHAVGQRLGTILVWVNKSYSRGAVTLASADPAAAPAVDFRLLSDPRDRQRLAAGIRLAAEFLAAPDLQGIASDPFPAVFSDRVRRISAPTPFNGMQTVAFGAVLDLAGGLRDRVIREVITRGTTLSGLLADETVMDRFLTEAVGGTWHASGTCRMGRPDDPEAVTDPEGRVYGVEGLRVCDASLMPSIPCANTNLPTMMMAERIADLMKATAPAHSPDARTVTA